MTTFQPWTSIYRPKKREDFIGNEKAVEELEKWLKSWRKKPPKKRAAFIYGPPGIGKTSIVQVLAKEYDYDLVEINASDSRSKSSIDETIGKAVNQNVTLYGQRRMVLVDEMDGLSGKHDRGGVSAVSNIIKKTSSPMILVANTIEENMYDRFRSILKLVKSIEFRPIDSSQVIKKLEIIVEDQGINIHPDILTEISINCSGDLRSATTDLETIARNKEIVTLEDTKVVDYRTRLDFTPNILNKIFASGSLKEARKTINQSMIKYDELYEWIYENIPIVLDEPKERLLALDALARADIHQKRASKNDWRLLKYFFDLMTGGITFSKKNSKGEGYKKPLITAIMSAGLSPNMISIFNVPDGIHVKPNHWLGKEKWNQLNASLRGIGGKWIYSDKLWLISYYREPQSKWRYIRSFHSRRRINSVTKRLALYAHTSSRHAKNEILPLLSYMIRRNEKMYDHTSKWMLEPPINKLENLRYMAFNKKPSDFVNLENYAKYKQREITKMIEKVADETETDTANIERWLADEKKKVVWK